MIDLNRTEIQLSKAKLTKLLFFCFCFLAIGLWMLIANPQTSNPMFNNQIFKTIVSCCSIFMGLFGIYFFTRKLFDKKPGLILDKQGIYDNTSAFKFGLIPWTDISEIYEKTVQTSLVSKQYFVTIELKDPEKYISRETNFLKKKLLLANSKNFGSPVHISTNGLKTNHKNLLKLINDYFHNYSH